MKRAILAIYLLFVLFELGYSEHLFAQTITTFIGTGTVGGAGDGGISTAAQLHYPHGFYVSSTGERYINDDGFHSIRKVDAAGIITRVAGTGIGGYGGDGGPATAASVDHPFDLVIDASGNIIFTDELNHRLRKITPGGIISTIAGTGIAGFFGDGGAATAAKLNWPTGIVIDGLGNIIFSDQYNHRIRKITPAGIISTIAGTGTVSFSGDGGPATAATFSYPNFLILDNSGNLIVTDNGNHRVRKIDATTGIITTIIGNGSTTYTGDGMAATASSLYYPGGVAVDPIGNMYVADNLHSRIRKVNTSGIISTVAGTGVAGFGGDGGPATSALLHTTVDVALDAAGNLYISDLDNHRVRVISGIAISTNHAPIFTIDGTGFLNVCQNSSLNPVGFLDVSDVDAGQTETYSVIVAPSHGSLSGFPTSVTATGGVINPVGITYTPTGLYYGSDTFTIKVSDGSLTDTLPFHVDVFPNTAGLIVGPDVVCIGGSISFTDYITGGIWSSTNNTLATVSATGVVLGIAAGVDTIKYSVPNICNAGTVIHVVTVLTPEECAKLTVNNIATSNSQLSISPNPNNGSFTLNYAGKTDIKIVVTDMTGRKMADYDMMPNKQMDIHLDVAPGIYFLSAFDGVSVHTVKMVVVQK